MRHFQSWKFYRCFLISIFWLIFFCDTSLALSLTSTDTDYITTGDITETSTHGISSTFAGTSDSYRKITNNHTITTGDDGESSGDYGIRTTQNYNEIINSSSGEIITTANSGRGISISRYSNVYNYGSISTQGTSSYGIYTINGNNYVLNSGSISTNNSDESFGISLNGDFNEAENSGSISSLSRGVSIVGNENQFTNSGNITTTVGTSAHGIFISAASASTASSTSYNIITNSGTINANAEGIINSDNYSRINNSGSITSSQSNSYAIRNEGEEVVINNSGTLTSTNYAIYNLGNNSTITNSGTINGGVYLSASTLNILGGSISGEINGTSFNATVNIGDSSSTLEFDQQADFIDILHLSILSQATLNVNNSITATNLNLSDQSILNLNEDAEITASIKANSASQGVVNINGDSTINGIIGSSNAAISELNITSNASLNFSNNIYADQIIISGELNFNQIDNLTIAGDVTLNSSSNLDIGDKNQIIDGDFSTSNSSEISFTLANNQSGKLTVSGDISIDENTKFNILSSQNYINNNANFEIISSLSSLSSSSLSISSTSQIDDDNVSINDGDNIYRLYRFSIVNNSGVYSLKVNHLNAAEVSKNSNNQAIYQNLVSIGSSASGKLSDYLATLYGNDYTQSQIDSLLSEISPTPTKATLLTINNVVEQSVKVSENYLFSQEKNLTKNNENWFDEVWGQVFGGGLKQDQASDDAAFKASSAGIAFGGVKKISTIKNQDKKIGEERFQISVSTAKSNYKTNDFTKQNNIDNHQINFSYGKNINDYFFHNFLSFSFNQFDSNRAINTLSSNAIARYSGQTYAFKSKFGMIKKISKTQQIIPEISAKFMHNFIDSYVEEDAEELNLAVDSVSANLLEAKSSISLNSKIDKTALFLLNEIPEIQSINARIGVSYGYFLINDKPTTSARFINSNQAFSQNITDLDDQNIELNAILSIHHQEDVDFNFGYNFEKRSSLNSHSLIFNVRQIF
jgi:hypothetical protein